jgi:hypothetical protein
MVPLCVGTVSRRAGGESLVLVSFVSSWFVPPPLIEEGDYPAELRAAPAPLSQRGFVKPDPAQQTSGSA